MNTTNALRTRIQGWIKNAYRNMEHPESDHRWYTAQIEAYEQVLSVLRKDVENPS